MEFCGRRQWLALAAGAGFAACGRRAEPPQAPRILRVGMAQTIAAMVTLRLGEELGHFREAGLGLEYTTTSSGSTLIPSLVSGKLDLYIGSLSPALLTREALGAGIRVALAREAVKPGCTTWGGIYGLKRSFPRGLADLRELKGKKIAVTNRGSITEFGLDVLAAAAGLRDVDVEAVILRQAEALGAMAAGRIDGMFSISYSPGGLGELAEKAALFPGVERVAPGLQTSFILFGGSLRGAERRAGEAFLRAYRRSSRDFVSGKTPRDFDEIAKRNGVDPGPARASCRDSAVSGGVVQLEHIQRYADWALRKKYIESAVKAEEIVDASLAAEASV